MTEKLSYEDFKNKYKYLSRIIIEQDAQKQYDEYCFRWENNKREK